eukprot:gene18715-24474_t
MYKTSKSSSLQYIK